MILHLRDQDIQVRNFALLPETSAFGDFVNDKLLGHADAPIHEPNFLENDKSIRGEENRIFIVHTAERTAWVAAQNRNEIRGHVVFASSTRVVATDLPQNAHPRTHACFWKPKEFNTKNQPDELRKFLIQIGSGVDPDWALLQPSGRIPDDLAAWALWKQAEEMEVLTGKTRPTDLLKDGSERLIEEFKVLSVGVESDVTVWKGFDLQPVKKLLALAAQKA